MTIFAACGSDGGKAGPSVPDPAITITSPEDMGSVIITTDPDVDVGFAVTNFELKEPGTCAGAAGCGHVHLHVNGHDCDDHEDGETNDFNAETAESPVGAGLDYCTDAVMGVPKDGTYHVEAGLYDDDESVVKGSSGKAVATSIDISVKVEAPSDAGAGSGDGGT